MTVQELFAREDAFAILPAAGVACILVWAVVTDTYMFAVDFIRRRLK